MLSFLCYKGLKVRISDLSECDPGSLAIRSLIKRPNSEHITLRRLKKLDVEIGPNHEAIEFLRSFRDVCPALEVLQIYMVGRARGGIRAYALKIGSMTLSKLGMLALYDDSYDATYCPCKLLLNMYPSLTSQIRNSEKLCCIERRGVGWLVTGREPELIGAVAYETVDLDEMASDDF